MKKKTKIMDNSLLVIIVTDLPTLLTLNIGRITFSLKSRDISMSASEVNLDKKIDIGFEM